MLAWLPLALSAVCAKIPLGLALTFLEQTSGRGVCLLQFFKKPWGMTPLGRTVPRSLRLKDTPRLALGLAFKGPGTNPHADFLKGNARDKYPSARHRL